MSPAGATVAYVALGSNLGDSRQLVLDAIEALDTLPSTQVSRRSRLFQTPPWGVLAQPPFINAVVQLHTALAPHALLDALLAIESAAGRIRAGERWGPRTLDLDILYMNGVVLDDTRLTLPHPRIAERAFVLLPLVDIAADLVLPGMGTVREQLARIPHADCQALT